VAAAASSLSSRWGGSGRLAIRRSPCSRNEVVASASASNERGEPCGAAATQAATSLSDSPDARTKSEPNAMRPAAL
jgi:hypothetical protein